MNLDQLFTFAAGKAGEIFARSGEVVPMWHAVTRDGDNIVIATPWESAEEKHRTADLLRAEFKRLDVVRYVFICEGWTVEARSVRDAEDVIRVSPSKHEDRREILMVNAEDANGEQRMGVYYILRPEHGPAKLSPFHPMPGGTNTGTLSCMFA